MHWSLILNYGKNHSTLHHFRDKCVLCEIQDGRPKWQETDFWEKFPVDSADTLGVTNFDEIALSRTVSDINAFFVCFTQKFKIAAKSGRKSIFGRSCEFALLILWE